MPFSNTASQKRNFEAILAGLQRIGYEGDLLCRKYAVRDWFGPASRLIKIDAAAFGRTPVSYDNACFAVVRANGTSGTQLISQCRALGAPRALELRGDRIFHWKVTSSPSEGDLWEVYEPDQIEAVFDAHRPEWRPDAVLRARNIAAPGQRQLDFVDVGLIPALEREIHKKLDPLLREIVDSAWTTYKQRKQIEPDWDQLCRLVFRSLAGKIMHDRSHPGFRSFHDTPDADTLLKKVETHYRDYSPTTDDPQVRQLVVDKMWDSFGFENLSVEILAYIWENTLVSKEVRKDLGIHATPPSIARYIVHRLPIEDIPQADRHVVEPCCGSGTFLVAALQRLRELLPLDMDASQRHTYFARHLTGFDIEGFGLEVARFSLMLADYPNPNGWRLKKEDVFETPENAPEYHDAISRAGIILCNPPFEKFDDREPSQSVYKPAELLLRLLQAIPGRALVGFVLPRAFLDGRSYRETRNAITRRFQEIELVSLPDKVFKYGEHETALLMAHAPRGDSKTISLFHRKISETGVLAFLNCYEPTREDRAERNQEAASEALSVPDLQEIWERLSDRHTLADSSQGIHRGIEWNIPLTVRDPETGKRRLIEKNSYTLVSDASRPGFRKGLREAQGDLQAFECPPTAYLNFKEEYRRGNAFDLPWNENKVVLNASTKSRGAWTIAASSDKSGLVCYQTFTCIWPSNGWTSTALACVLNGPLSCAFVRSHEDKIHIRKTTLSKIPMPDPKLLDQEQLSALVEQYVSSVRSLVRSVANEPRRILRRIDALVLKAYQLPPRLERDLLDYFRGHTRPVPFDFGDYYPEDFKAYIPLWMYDSSKFQNSTVQRFLDEFPKIDDLEVLDILKDL